MYFRTKLKKCDHTCHSCGQPLRIKSLVFEKSVFVAGEEKTPHELCGALISEKTVMSILLNMSNDDILNGLEQERL